VALGENRIASITIFSLVDELFHCGGGSAVLSGGSMGEPV